MRTSRRCPSNSAGIEADDAEVVPPAVGNADIETMSLQQKCSLCFVPSVYPRLISFATLDGGAQKHLRTVVLRQPSSLFLHLPRGHPVQSPFASLRANLRFTICALSCFVSPPPPLNTSGDTDFALSGGGSRRLPWRPSRTPSTGR